MLRNFLIAFGIVLLTGVLTLALNAYFKSEKGSFFLLEDGKPIPDFAFETLDGKEQMYSDYTDKPSLVHFWATWCPPCVVEFPELVAFAKDNPEVTVLAVSSDRNKEAIERFLTQKVPDLPPNFLIIQDNGSVITQKKFSVFALPETFYAKEGGVLVKHIVGPNENWSEFAL